MIHISYGTEPYDDVPAEVLLEHVEGLGLVYHFAYAGGIFPARHLEEEAVMVGAQAPNSKITGRGNQFAIVVVRRVSQGVIVCVSFSAGFQQADLVFVAGFAEFLDGAVCLNVVAVEGEVFLYQFVHAGFQGGEVFRGKLRVVGLPQVAEVAVGDGMLHVQLAAGKDILRGLVQQKTK